jgi:hypothetical protein
MTVMLAANDSVCSRALATVMFSVHIHERSSALRCAYGPIIDCVYLAHAFALLADTQLDRFPNVFKLFLFLLWHH